MEKKIICDQIWSKTCIWSNLITSFLGGGEKNNKMFFSKNRNEWQKIRQPNKNKKNIWIVALQLLIQAQSMAPKAIEIFKKGQQIIYWSFCYAPLFLGAKKQYACCLEEPQKNIHMFLESTNFAEECFPYGSLGSKKQSKKYSTHVSGRGTFCWSWLTKWFLSTRNPCKLVSIKSVFGDMCSFYLLVKNQFFVLMVTPPFNMLYGNTKEKKYRGRCIYQNVSPIMGLSSSF